MTSAVPSISTIGSRRRAAAIASPSRVCAFSRTSGEEGAYTLALEEICRRAVEAEGEGATEVQQLIIARELLKGAQA